MSRTNDLRKLIQTKLKTVCSNVYYENADDKKLYPHCVYTLLDIDTSDTAFARNDCVLTIDVWDMSTSAYAIEDLCDDIEDLFNNSNVPQSTILPTFFISNRQPVNDDDKNIRHRIIRVSVQNYERGEQ